MGWTDPTDPEFFEIKKYVGSLVLVAVNEYLPVFTTAQGTAPAVRAEVAVVDGPGAGDRYPDAMFFGKRIVPQLQRSVGSTVLGRIGLGDKKAGQNAPYQLDKAGAGDAEKANAYVQAHGDVESRPVETDTSQAGGGGYAPDNEQWASQRNTPPQQQPSLPTPPSYPTTNTGAGETYTQPARVGGGQGDDEPPF